MLYPKFLIEKFVKEHQNWITKRLSRISTQQVEKKTFTQGEYYLFLGKKFMLNLVPEQTFPLLLDDFEFTLLEKKQANAAKVFENWYKLQAQIKFTSRLNFWATQQHIKYKYMKVTSAQKRWGSCSRDGRICLTWRLIMAPLEVIDYVIVHELTHILVPNHSAKFWGKVDEIYPTFKLQRKWLRENGYSLHLT